MELAELYDDLKRELLPLGDPQDVFHVLSHAAARRVPGAEYAGITRITGTGLETIAPTDDVVLRVDAIQYDLEAGPCVDAVVKEQVFNARDLRTDDRWPEFGRRAAETEGIQSMLSFRLYVEDDDAMRVGLNCYSSQLAAFDDTSELIGLLLATHGALAVRAAVKTRKVENLEIALKNSREIGIAMGVLMTNHKITREQAFDLLRVASQHTHRKLAAIAAEVVDTGDLLLHVAPPTPHRR